MKSNYSSTWTKYIIYCVFLTICYCCKTVSTTSSSGIIKESSKECVDRIIAIDDSLGTIRNHACKTISLSQTIKNYTDGLSNIDYTSCPKIFTQAFQFHIEAWLDMMEVTDHYPQLRGEMHDLFDAIEKGVHKELFDPRLKAIWDTWADIESAMKE